MFTEAEKATYRAVKAPEELRQRVLRMADTAPAARRRPMRGFIGGAVAACLLLALLAATLLPRADLSVSVGEAAGEESGIAVLSRAAAPLRLPVTVTTRDETALSVSRGRLCDEAGETVDRVTGSRSLFWEIDDPDETARYTLTARGGEERLTLTLAFDTATGRWTARAAEE